MSADELSKAELASLAAVALHDYAHEAARARNVTEGTLKNELTRAFKKLGVKTRQSAWRELGWLNPPADHHRRFRKPA